MSTFFYTKGVSFIKKILKHMIAIILVFAVFINYVPKLDFNDSSLVTIESTETEAFVLTSTTYLLLTALAVGGSMITAKYIENNKEQITRFTNKLWEDIKTAGGAVLSAIETGLAESGQNAYVNSQTMEAMAVEVRDFVYNRYGTTKDVTKSKTVVFPELANPLELDFYVPAMSFTNTRHFDPEVISPVLPFINESYLNLPYVQSNGFTMRITNNTSVSNTIFVDYPWNYIAGGGSSGETLYLKPNSYVKYDLVAISNQQFFTTGANPVVTTIDNSNFLNNDYSNTILYYRIKASDTSSASIFNKWDSSIHTNLRMRLATASPQVLVNLNSTDYAYIPFVVNDVNGVKKMVGGSIANQVANNYANAKQEVTLTYVPQTNAQVSDRVQSLTNQAGTITLPHEKDLDRALDNLLDSATNTAGSIAIDFDAVNNNEIPLPGVIVGDIDFPDLDFDTDVPDFSNEVSGGLLTNLFTWLISKLLAPLTWLGSLIKTGFNAMKSILDSILTAVFSIPQLLSDIKSLIFSIPGLLTDIKDFVVGIPGYLSDILGGILSLPGWLSDIFNGIIALPGLIVDGLVSTFQWVISLPTTIYNSIVAALEWVFVPDMSKVQVKLDGMILTMVNRFPIFYQIVDLFNALFGGLSSAPPSFKITMPIKWGGGTYSVFDIAMIDPYLPMIKNIFSVFIWLPFLWKFLKKIANFRN